MSNNAIQFLKMHGLGNDFVVVDARAQDVALDPVRIRAIADRRTGVGCDQFITLEDAAGDGDVFMRIHNADGGEVEACGNAARCVGKLMLEQTATREAKIATASGTVIASAGTNGDITIDMGAPRLDWRDIPVSEACDTLHLPLSTDGLSDPVGVNMGNPHAVFFVEDAEAVPVQQVGPRLEHAPLFPERANISFVQVLGRDRMRFRVWERGVGVTRACGTGACAALVAAVRRELTDRTATLLLDGGPLSISWAENDHVLMSGPASLSFTGHLDLSALS